jgi:hypothetical protein
VGPSHRARDAALLIVVLAMAGVAVSMIVAFGAATGFDATILAAGGVVVASALASGLIIFRRRHRWRDGIPIASTAPRKAIPDPLSASGVPIEPRMRELELGEEVNMPRWLRPSVRAERFSGEHTAARSQADPPAPGEFETASAPVDLDALFAARRKAAASATRKVPRRRRTAPAD